VIKCLILSKILYSATMLNIPEGIIKSVNRIIYNNLWGARDKIKRNCIINKKEHFGLSMIDVESQFLSLKAKWLHRLIKCKTSLSIIPNYFFLRLGCLKYCTNMSFITVS